MSVNRPGNDLHTGTRAAKGAGGTGARQEGVGAPGARFCVPSDLAAFVVAHTVTEVAAALGMSRHTAYRLREGYWPRDVRAILSHWDGYKGRSAQQQGRWLLRRVYPGGAVLHAGRTWSARGLAVRVGQSLAVARTVDGVLLAQTLDLPAQRLVLEPMALPSVC